MGYSMTMNGSTFFVSSANTGRVLAAMKHQPFDLKLDDDGNITGISFCGKNLVTI